MYDKIEIPLPAHILFRPDVDKIRSELRAPNTVIPFKSSRYYAAMVDLRELTGTDAMLHLGSRMGKNKGSHKLELLDCGEKGYEEILGQVAAVIEESPWDQKVGRLDCCVDVDGVPVEWFHKSMRAQWKQWQAKFGKTELESEYSEMGKRRLQTIYAGKRPNCIRVYDKTAELWERQYPHALKKHKRLLRDRYFSELANGPRDLAPVPADVMARLEADFPFPSFEKMFGIPETHVRTRVERQMAAGKVPRQLNRLYKLLDGAKFNPFENLRFVGGGAVEVSPYDYSPGDWLLGTHILRILRDGEMSWQELRAFLNRGDNAVRYEKRFRPFIDAGVGAAEKAITAEELYERYRGSVERQLAA